MRFVTVILVFVAALVPQALVAVTLIVPLVAFGVALIVELVLLPVQPLGKVHVYEVGLPVALVVNVVAVLAQTAVGVMAVGVPGNGEVVKLISAP